VVRTFLASNCVKEVENSTGFEREERLLQVAYQVSVLALEMTEDILRDASDRKRNKIFVLKSSYKADSSICSVVS